MLIMIIFIQFNNISYENNKKIINIAAKLYYNAFISTRHLWQCMQDTSRSSSSKNT